MDKKRIVLTAGALLFALGLGLNLQYSMNGYGISENSLHVQVWAQSSGSDSSGKCTLRGGTEMPKQVFQIDTECIVEYSYPSGGGSSSGGSSSGGSSSGGSSSGGSSSGGSSSGGSVTIVYGSRCVCKSPPRGYAGTLGCNLSWETPCSK